jgi:hypothetical protein
MTATNEDGEHGPDDPGFAPGGPRDWAAGGEPADDGDDEDGFVPPPVVLVASTVLTYAVPTALFVAICAVFVAGVGVLVWRLPSHHSPEDDGDNGAVV